VLVRESAGSYAKLRDVSRKFAQIKAVVTHCYGWDQFFDKEGRK